MTLNELFTSYNQVFPVTFQSNDNEIYSNLNRAKSASNNWKTGQHSSDSLYRHWKTDIIPLNNQTKNIKYDNNNENYKNFDRNLNTFINTNNQYEYLKYDLTAIAKLESEFDQTVGNNSSTAIGWFQFLDGTRREFSSLTKEEFVNDPQEQLLAASKRIRTLKKQITNWGGNPDDFPTLYLAWWNPGSAKEYCKTGKLSNESINGGNQNETPEKIYNKAKDLVNGKS